MTPLLTEIIVLLLPIVLGFVVLRNMVATADKGLRWILLFAGTGFGMGISSWLFVICYWSHLPAVCVLGTEIPLLLSLGWWLRTKSNATHDVLKGDPNLWTRHISSYKWISAIPFIILWLVITNFFVSYFTAALQSPHGGGDAYMIWNLKARFLYRSDTSNWKSIFSDLISYSHPDYPLLVSGFIASAWKMIGDDDVMVPILTHFAFAGSTVGLLFAALARFASRISAVLAALFLLCTPVFWLSAKNQFADLPLGFFFLGSIIFLMLAHSEPDKWLSRQYFLCCGAFVAFSMWTKNEGILFFMAIIFSLAVRAYREGELKRAVTQLMYFAVGAGPVLIFLAGFKVLLVPANDLVAAQGNETLQRMTDFSRYITIVKAYATFGWGFGQWWIPPIPLAIAYGYVTGKNQHRDNKNIVDGIVIFTIMLLGYFFIYVNTHLDLTGHLNSSLDRLFSQLMPSLLLLFFLSFGTPEEYVIKTFRPRNVLRP